MVQTQEKGKRKISTPSEGYICSICNIPGHWIQQCPQKQKRRKKSQNHVYTPGVDPSQADIDKAREMQKIKPPNCFCGSSSRLKKVKRSNAGENSRAIGKYFFFCSKGKYDESKCKFARPIGDHLKPKKERICTFFAKTGFCKKGDQCMFSHSVEGDNRQTPETQESVQKEDNEDKGQPTRSTKNEFSSKNDISSSSDSSSSDSSSDSSDSSDGEA